MGYFHTFLEGIKKIHGKKWIDKVDLYNFKSMNLSKLS